MSDSYRVPRSMVLCLISFVVFGLTTLIMLPAIAQTQSDITPNRITEPLNPNVRVTLLNNVPPLAQAKYDQGAAPGTMETGRIMLVLKRSDVQENALKQTIADLQNPNSPNYRKWLTPTQFGSRYGISDTDLNTVTGWLESQGFTVEKVPAARTFIIFSGNLAQIQQAFNTVIHRYSVDGETHLANSSDPQIPAALAPVIAGISRLNDFRPKPGVTASRAAHFDPETNRIKPDLTLPNTTGNGSTLFTTPADAATIYDTPNSALNGNYSKSSSLVGGKSYDGTGVTIGVVGDANINAEDIANYRAAFMPSSYSANQPSVVVDGNDPGLGRDSIEALLDLEVSGGVAPGAKIIFYTSASVGLSQGLDFAIGRALADNNVSILNVSFGECESFLGSAGNQTYSMDWEQAAAQGITVTVAAGDTGSAGCEPDSTVASAQTGLAVSGVASTAYNVAVGGTDYDPLLNNFATYVSSSNVATNYYGTALSYIPESPWNDSTTPPNTGAYSANQPATNGTISSGGGGVSSCTQSSGTPPNITCVSGSGYPVPPFQTGTPNFSFHNRALPDVSLLAGDGTYNALWLICSDSDINNLAGLTASQVDCQQTGGKFTADTTFTGGGGTSAASPALAGMLALVSQSQGGVRLGQANNVLYNLAAQSTLYPTVFHDVTAGNNSVACVAGAPDCGSNGFLNGYNAGTGYDAATGLGSIDATQLVANWTKASFTPTTTAFKINGGTSPISVTHGTSLDLDVAVSPGTATGDVSFINNSGVDNGQALIGFVQPLSAGAASVSTGDLPGSPHPYNVYAYYGGDVKNAASQSNPVRVTISPESSSVVLGMSATDPSGGPLCDDVDQGGVSCKGQTIPYGFITLISAHVKASSGSNTVATGNIVLADTAASFPVSTLPISSAGTAAFSNDTNPLDSLSVGAHGLTATYAGDGSYQASNSGSAYTFTIAKSQTTFVLTGDQSGANVDLLAVVSTHSIGVAPTGTVTFQAGSVTLGTASTSSPGLGGFEYQLTVPTTTKGLVNGNNTITASYSGDNHYTGSNGNTVVSLTLPAFSVGGPYETQTVVAGTPFNANVFAFSAGGFSGTVDLSCAITSSPHNAVNPPTCSVSPTSVSLSSAPFAESQMTFSTSASTTTGAYVVTLTGTSNSVTETSTVNFTVTSGGAVGSFTISGPALNVVAGVSTGNTAATVVTPTNGFSGMVALTCAITSSPSNAVSPPTCALSPTSVSINNTTLGASTLAIGTTATTTTGAYVVTMTGTSGSTTANGTVNLTVSASSSAGSFDLSGTAVTVTAGANSGNTSTIAVTPDAGFVGAVNLKCSLTSSPSGAMDPATCSIPSSVLINGTSAVSSTMTVTTTAPTSRALAYPLRNLLQGASGTALACVFMLIGTARRKAWRNMLCLIAFAIVGFALTGCGGGGGSHTTGGTTPGTYVFTVSGSSLNSGGGANASTTVQVSVN
jgi:trimeric autotransporter adhesin